MSSRLEGATLTDVDAQVRFLRGIMLFQMLRRRRVEGQVVDAGVSHASMVFFGVGKHRRPVILSLLTEGCTSTFLANHITACHTDTHAAIKR